MYAHLILTQSLRWHAYYPKLLLAPRATWRATTNLHPRPRPVLLVIPIGLIRLSLRLRNPPHRLLLHSLFPQRRQTIHIGPVKCWQLKHILHTVPPDFVLQRPLVENLIPTPLFRCEQPCAFLFYCSPISTCLPIKVCVMLDTSY